MPLSSVHWELLQKEGPCGRQSMLRLDGLSRTHTRTCDRRKISSGIQRGETLSLASSSLAYQTRGREIVREFAFLHVNQPFLFGFIHKLSCSSSTWCSLTTDCAPEQPYGRQCCSHSCEKRSEFPTITTRVRFAREGCIIARSCC